MKVQKLKKKLALTICMIAVFIAMTGTAKAQPTVISVQPSHVDVPEPGLTFTVNLTITDSPAIVNWMVAIQYNPNVLVPIIVNETVEMGVLVKQPLVDEGDFLSREGSSALMVKWLNSTMLAAGKMPEITCILLEPFPAASSGDGVLCTLHFNTTASGQSDITIYDSALLDENEQYQEHTRQNGTVTVIPEFPAALILPLFLITTAIIVGVSKIAWTKRRRGYVDVP